MDQAEVISLPSSAAYRYVDLGMVIMGLRPLETQNKHYQQLHKFWSLTVLFNLMVFLPISYVIAFLKNISNTTPGELMATLEIFFNLPACGIKVYILLMNRERIQKSRELLTQMYGRCRAPEERLHINRLIERCDTYTKLYVVAYLMTPTLILVSSVLSGHVPFNIYIPGLDWTQSQRNLLLASVIEYVLLSMGISCCITVDCMPFIFSLTVRAHLELLMQRVEKLRTDGELTEEQNYEDLVLCIIDHKLILEYCANMRSLISRSLFVQFTVIGLVLACTLIHLVFFANLLAALSSIWYLATCVLQSFPVCLTCDFIAEDCFNLAYAIFHSNWIGANRRYTSALIRFIHNAQQPIKFLGGGFLPICLTTYVQMVKMAFSMITFVKQTNLFENVN